MANYFSNILEANENLRKTKKDLKQEKKAFNKELKTNSKTKDEKKEAVKAFKNEQKLKLREARQKVADCEPLKISKFTRLHPYLSVFIILAVFLIICIGMVIYANNRPNYENNYFSLRYDKSMFEIDEYNENTWVISSGGGIMDTSMMLIFYTEDTDFDLSTPIENMKNVFDGEVSEETTLTSKDDFLEESFILEIDEDDDTLYYQAMCKGYKTDNGSLFVFYLSSSTYSDITYYKPEYLKAYKSIKCLL